MVTVGFRSRCTLRTDVTSSRDIPRTWRLEYPDERRRERGKGGRRRRMPRWMGGWEQDPWERLRDVLSRRPRAWGCWLVLLHTDRARNQAQLRTRIQQKQADWRSNPPKLDFNKHPTYLPIREARDCVRLYATIRNKRRECNASSASELAETTKSHAKQLCYKYKRIEIQTTSLFFFRVSPSL